MDFPNVLLIFLLVVAVYHIASTAIFKLQAEPMQGATFYLRKHRYGPRANIKGVKAGDKVWDVEQTAGANNTCGDVLWHYMEPRMILMDNCMRCGEYGKNSKVNAPYGVSYSGAAGKESKMYEFKTPKGPHSLSAPRNTGIVPMTYDCAHRKVYDNAKYGCDGFGKYIYNFHA